MHSVGGVAHYHVALAVLRQQVSHIAAVEMAIEFYLHRLVAARNGAVVAHKNGSKHLNPLHASAVDICSRCNELMLHRLKEYRVAVALADKAIAVLYSLVVADKVCKVFAVALRYYLVHESAAFFAGATN